MDLETPDTMIKSERDFDIDVALFLAQMSDLAYRTEFVINNALKKMGATDCCFIEEGDSQCFYARFTGFQVIAFRGTELDAGDILSDLKFRKRDLEEIGVVAEDGIERVHRGFYEAYIPLHNRLIEHLKGFKLPLYITGHSLGGAMAVLCGAILPDVDNRIVYTFGSPRVGNSTFVENIGTWDGSHRHHRVVNSLDVVPMLPFMAMGFKHSGTLHYIDSQGEIQSAIPLQKQIINQIKTFVASIARGQGWLGFVPKAPFTCHLIKSYRRALDTASRKTVHSKEKEKEKSHG